MMRAVARKLTECPNCALAAFGILFAASIVIVFAADLEARYDRSIEFAKDAALNRARVVAEDAARSFESFDHALRVAEALRHIQRASPMIVSIGWSNAAGGIVASSNETQGRTQNVAATAA